MKNLPEIVAVGEILINLVALEPGSYVNVLGFLERLGGAPMNCIIVAKTRILHVNGFATSQEPAGEAILKNSRHSSKK